jgi:serine/threonine-protein kinase
MTQPGAVGLREGDVLAGKYRVERVLGVGGMGMVIAARHIELDERVAIKFLLPEVACEGDAVTRFAREARAAVKIKSEHVAKVTDVGKLDNGAPYMVMEYLEGSDLALWLARQGPLPVEQAVEFVLQACEAISEAHTLGIVHRDLKPGNLFVTRRPDGALSIKVLDFGISKTTIAIGTGASGSMTRTSALMGSPLYMSPEQMQSSRDVDARSDIWALGVILYELLSGKRPFVADTMPELVLRVVQGAPPAELRSYRPDVPDALQQVIQKCLEKDRRARYESVGELAVALVPFGPKRARISVERISGVMREAGLPSAMTAMAPSSGSDPAPAASPTAASFGRTVNPRGRSIWLVAAFGVLALGVGALLFRAGGTGSPAAGDPSASVGAPLSPSPAEAPPSALPPSIVPAAALPASPAPSSAPSAAPAAASAAPSNVASPSVPPSSSRERKVVRAVTAAKPPPPPPTAPPRATAPPPRPAAPPPAAAPAVAKPNIFDDRK